MAATSFGGLRPPDEGGPEEESQRKKAHRYVIFKFDEKKREVVVEKTGSPAESYDDFVAALPDNDCRYAIYDFDFVTSENCQKSKTFFIAWSPSTARIREKMLYATSKDRFRKEAGRYTLRDSGYLPNRDGS